jgi:hypothetical protein
MTTLPPSASPPTLSQLWRTSWQVQSGQGVGGHKGRQLAGIDTASHKDSGMPTAFSASHVRHPVTSQGSL